MVLSFKWIECSRKSHKEGVWILRQTLKVPLKVQMTGSVMCLMVNMSWTRALIARLSSQRRCASPLNVGLISTSPWGWIQINYIWSTKSLMTVIRLPQQWNWEILWTLAPKITNNEQTSQASTIKVPYITTPNMFVLNECVIWKFNLCEGWSIY